MACDDDFSSDEDPEDCEDRTSCQMRFFNAISPAKA